MHPSLVTLRDSKQPRLIHAALEALWADMRVGVTAQLASTHLMQGIAAGRARYIAAGRATGVPWCIVGILHQLECGGSFALHLHNGDPLTARTKQVPAGRPKGGRPPFSWEDSAIDALRYDGLHHVGAEGWASIGVTLDTLERYNGLGYRRRCIATPYLWGGSNHYERGKYIADGRFDANTVSRQTGAAVLLQACVAVHYISFRVS
jgi:lysozyme family protein